MTINGIAVSMMDSFYLSHVLQQLEALEDAQAAAKAAEDALCRTNGRLTLGSEDLTSGAQSTCDETMKSLGVTHGTVLELVGSALSRTGAFTIAAPKIPVPPTPDVFYTLPPGTGFCCSKICECGRSLQAADVTPMVPLEELEPPTSHEL